MSSGPRQQPLEYVKGELPGLDDALLNLLGHYRPGSLGVCVVEPGMRVVLPVESPFVWGWLESLTSPTAGAGDATALLIYTVPMDERNWLDSTYWVQVTGDNLIAALWVVPPAEYGSDPTPDATTVGILNFSTNPSRAFWPDSGGIQANIQLAVPGPILMEPGTEVYLKPDGTGAATSTWLGQLRLRRTKLVRALAP